ncbi:TPA: efflux RND transporter periplasmic adaptor subunit [Pseudomonas aeruginosa]|nr:efflux RND transporter periplasmic adaptor subunit [Pseudomonas aeruginosa]
MTNTSTLALDGVSFQLPDGSLLFSDLDETFDTRHTGLVGRNGVGKSLLARLLAGHLQPSSGSVRRQGRVRYLAQQLDPAEYPTVADLAGVRPWLEALARIEAGSLDAADYECLGERWDIRQRLADALAAEGLGHLRADTPSERLSGGECMRVALLGAFLDDADFLILDEPSNPLDGPARALLRARLAAWDGGLLLVSHDRELLEGMQRIVELSTLGLRSYGGGYSFYAQSREEAQASRASNQAQLKSAEQDLQRYRSLYAERAVSRQLLDQQQATVDQLRATLKANDATINAERVRLSYTRITSPVSGKVGIRNVDVGNLVRVGDSLGLFSVTQIAPISVVFSLQQEQLPQLQALLGGEAAVRAYSRDGGSALGEGRLLTIDNQIDSSTGTIRVRASFDNRQARLWPGQFVAVSLHTGVRRDQLVLSSKAVRRGLEGNFVYRVAADRVEAVPVRVLQDIDGLSVVEGLASGDQVVVDGHSRLMPGALVDIQEPRPSLAQAAERQP